MTEHARMQCPDTILSLRGVSRRYGSRVLFGELDLEVRRGGHCAILGPSGCGKTTLLRMIAGLDRPDAGTVSISGQPVAGGGIWVEPHRRGIGYVFQEPALWPHMNVEQNIRYGLAGWPRAKAAERVAYLLAHLSLNGLEKRRPDALSGGESRRIAIARSLAPSPALLLLDEPTTHLDADRRDDALAFLLDESKKTGATLLIVTHDLQEARRIAKGALVWTDGAWIRETWPLQAHAAHPGIPGEVNRP